MRYQMTAELTREIDETIEIELEAGDEDEAMGMAMELINNRETPLSCRRFLTTARHYREPEHIDIKFKAYKS